MSATHIYLVQSPLQAINATEARRATDLEGEARHVIFSFETHSGHNNEMVAKTLAYLGWREIFTVPFQRGVLAKLAGWFFLRRQLSGIGAVRRAYIGAYDAGLLVAAANFCRPQETWLIDDGTASLVFPAYRYEGVLSRFQNGGSWNILLGLDSRLPNALTFFSIYELSLQSPDRLERNHLRMLQQSLAYSDSGPVVFVGSIMPESGICNFETYEKWLRMVCAYFRGRQVTYYPHRREDLDRKLPALARLGITVARAELPFELALARASEPPSAIASFYTTVFDTLAIAGGGERGRLVAFHVPGDYIQERLEREMAAACYENYDRSGVVSVVRNWM